MQQQYKHALKHLISHFTHEVCQKPCPCLTSTNNLDSIGTNYTGESKLENMPDDVLVECLSLMGNEKSLLFTLSKRLLNISRKHKFTRDFHLKKTRVGERTQYVKHEDCN